MSVMLAQGKRVVMLALSEKIFSAKAHKHLTRADECKRQHMNMSML